MSEPKHFESRVVPEGGWKRLNGTVGDGARLHIIPIDEVGRGCMRFCKEVHSVGDRPLSILVEGGEIAFRYKADSASGAEGEMDILNRFAEGLRATLAPRPGQDLNGSGNGSCKW